MNSAVLVFGARVILLVLLYLFLYFVVQALRRDLRAAARQAQAPATPSVSPAATPAAPASTLALEVVEAGQTALRPGDCFPIRDPLLIGRSRTNDITLDDDWVSSQHVRLRRQNNTWLAEDMGSTNGTRINGRPLRGAVRVRPGDVLHVGRVKLKLVEAQP